MPLQSIYMNMYTRIYDYTHAHIYIYMCVCIYSYIYKPGGSCKMPSPSFANLRSHVGMNMGPSPTT